MRGLLQCLVIIGGAVCGATPALAQPEERDRWFNLVYLRDGVEKRAPEVVAPPGSVYWAPASLPWLKSEGSGSEYREYPHYAHRASLDDAVGWLDVFAGSASNRTGRERLAIVAWGIGANVAMAYAARHGHKKQLAGVVILGSALTPELASFRSAAAAGVREAEEKLRTHRGIPIKLPAPPSHQGRMPEVSATPEAYLSYFHPDGPALLPRIAASMPPVPLLWVVGRKDELRRLGPGYAFDRAPRHEKSRYLEVDADHATTGAAVGAQIEEWLKAL